MPDRTSLNGASAKLPPMRVLMVYDCLYPRSLGGVEKRNFELATVLAERGHEVTLASWADGQAGSSGAIRILDLGERPPLYTGEGRRSTAAAARFAAAVSRVDLRPFDVIETANIPYLHVLPLAARARLQQRPLLVTWHEYWGRYWRDYVGRARWPAFASIELAAAQAGTRAVAVSSLTAGRLARRRRGASPEVVPNGAPVGRIAEAAQAAESGPELIYAGRFLREKRLDLLFDAMARLSPRHGDVRLTLIGDGPMAAEVPGMLQARGLTERVVVLGRLPATEDVWSALGTARVAVQPSSREGFGLFPLEAMAAGLPVVYCESPESALPELVRDGVEGICVPATADGLAAALGGLMEDAAVRDRMSAAARVRAANYDWRAVGSRLEQIMAGLAAR